MADTDTFDAFLRKYALCSDSEQPVYQPLTGGVSSDIYRVDLPGRSLCIKRALPKLKVAADWQAPISRSTFEWEWLSFVAARFPHAVPQPLAHDEATGIFAMSFLSGAAYPLWKSQLLQGVVDVPTASATGALIADIHASSANSAMVAKSFDSTANFYALRLEPYLIATARKHPEISDTLNRLADDTGATRLALVHGDVSPKNILVGPEGPVLLDAECAWYGDPAFDLSFCLNHMLLKRLVVPELSAKLEEAFVALRAAYIAKVDWEAPDALEKRAAVLLPALFLARIDGKSPVEYVMQDAQRKAVRDCAIPLIKSRPDRLLAVSDAWFLQA